MPPEGPQQTQNSTGRTQIFGVVVADCAANSTQTTPGRPQATLCDQERTCAIDLWIAHCPVQVSEAIMVGIRAMILASAFRRL